MKRSMMGNNQQNTLVCVRCPFFFICPVQMCSSGTDATDMIMVTHTALLLFLINDEITSILTG